LLLNLSFRCPALVFLITAGVPTPTRALAVAAAYTAAGRHIGNFQVLLMRCVRAYTNTSQYREAARAISLECTWFGGHDPAEETENSE
jgi:hypothetical protein